MSNESWLDKSTVDGLRRPFDGICWWCRARPADTGEHKFKVTDLAQIWDEDGLSWFGSDGAESRQIRGKSALRRDRHGVLKFPKSLCNHCNNSASQPFDRAYEKYSAFATATFRPRMTKIDLQRIYNQNWQSEAADLARYFVKHFGCRLVANGMVVPESMRAFLNGTPDMRDVHLALLTTREVNTSPRAYGLSSSFGAGFTNRERTRFTGMVTASYVGMLGVRFQWQEEGFDSTWQSFFHFRQPVVNQFNTEVDVTFNRRKRGLLERLLR